MQLTRRIESLLPNRIRENYLWRLVAIFAVIVVLISTVGVVQYERASSTIEEEARADLLKTAEENIDVLSKWRADHSKTVGLLSNADALASDDEAQMNAYLSSQYEQLPGDIVDLSVVELSSGEVLASTTDGKAGTTMDRVEATAQSSYDDPAAVGSVPKHQWEGDGPNVISFFSPVPGAADRALVYSAETATVDERIKGSDESVTQLISREGAIAFDSTGENSGEQYPTDSAAFERAWNGESGVVVQSADSGPMDEKHLVAYTPYHEGLILVVQEPVSSAYSLSNQVASTIAVLVALTLVGLGLLGFVISRNTVDPLRGLAEKVRALRDGDLGVDLDTDREDEFASVLDGVAELRDDLVNQRDDAERYAEVMDVAATGDLSVRMRTDSDSRDMETIADSYNEMMDDLEDTVVTVRSFSDDVAALSEEVAASADEVSRASEEVSRSIQQIADGASEQNESLVAVSEEIDNMTASIQQVAASADELADYSQRTTAKGDEGREAANEALSGIDAIREETERTVAEMENLDDQMAEIGDIVEVISDIAEQTNILALNANIEAARAGDAGEGFAVVSNEVKSLAEETQSSAQQIEARIEELEAQQRTVLDGMERMRDRVEDGSESVDTAIDSFEEIIGAIDETTASVEEINDATSRQASSSQDILSMSEEATSISEETTAEAENVSAAAEEQTSTLAEVSNGVDRLAENANELKGRLEEFEVSGESGTRTLDHADAGAGADAAGDGDGDATGDADAAHSALSATTDGGTNDW